MMERKRFRFLKADMHYKELSLIIKSKIFWSKKPLKRKFFDFFDFQLPNIEHTSKLIL